MSWNVIILSLIGLVVEGELPKCLLHCGGGLAGVVFVVGTSRVIFTFVFHECCLPYQGELQFSRCLPDCVHSLEN